MTAEDHGHAPEATAPAEPAAPATPAARTLGGRERATRDKPLRVIKEAEYLSLDPEIQAALSDRIDLYYGTPLDIFPGSESDKKPDRFHVLFSRQIEERFPDDEDLRHRIHDYGRDMFHALMAYMFGKRGLQAVTLVGVAWIALYGPQMFGAMASTPPLPLALSILSMVVLCGIYVATGLIIFTQYRIGLENRSYELSREIVQRTRELQNLYTNVKAMPDQSETQFQMDGPGWGRRSSFLMRLVLWMAARLEYLEKYTQVVMWRVRRERYWASWGGGILTVFVLLLWAGVFFLLGPPHGAGEVEYRILQFVALGLGIAVSLWSYFKLQTPTTLVRDKLDSDSWIRYSSLDVDDAIGDQSRRDKERLVEYRSLTRGRG